MTTETRQEPADLGEKVATLQEARTAIESLRNEDYAKLMLIARYFAKNRLKGTLVEPGDLLHGAIVKTLDGQRRWNKQVTIVKHLDRVMESDSGHEAEKQAARGLSQLPEENLEPVDQQPSPEVRLLVHEELENLLDLFAADENALKILHLKADDFSASEIQRALGIEKREYDTVTRRIRRRLAKHLAQGSK